MASDPSPPLWKAGTNDSASLGLVFLLCRMGKVGPASPGSWEDQMRKDVNFGSARCRPRPSVRPRYTLLIATSLSIKRPRGVAGWLCSAPLDAPPTSPSLLSCCDNRRWAVSIQRHAEACCDGMLSWIRRQFLNCSQADVLGLPAEGLESGLGVWVSTHDAGTGLFHVCDSRWVRHEQGGGGRGRTFWLN